MYEKIKLDQGSGIVEMDGPSSEGMFTLDRLGLV